MEETSASAYSSANKTARLPVATAQENDAPNFERGFRFWAVIAGLAVTTLLAALEHTVVTTSAPAIVSDLQMGETYIWITNSFFICSTAFQPLLGQLCNVFGRRWVFITIVAVFTLGSGICGGATQGAMLIAGRAVQGVGSGGIVLTVNIIVSDLIPLRERGKYMAMILGVFGIGTSLGPFIGGAIVEATTWRWVFWINLPIGGVSLVLMWLFLHVQYDKEMSFTEKIQRIDLVGTSILLAGTVAILYSLTYAGTIEPWASWRTLVPLLLGFFGLALFAGYEMSGLALEPVMPPRLFQNRTSVVVILNTFIAAMAFYWFLYFLPIYFQAVLLYSPRQTGVSLLPQSLAGIPGAAIAAVCLSKWGKFKIIHLAGFSIATLGLGLFSYQDEWTHVAEWVIFQAICALGVGMVLDTLLPAFQAPTAEADQAAATSTWAFVRSFGCIWGVAIPAAVFNNFVDLNINMVSDSAVHGQLVGGGAYQHASAAFVRSFPPETGNEIRAVYRISLQRVFQVGVAFSGLAVLLALIERNIPLRKALETQYGLEKDPKDATEENAKPPTAEMSAGLGGVNNV
ncbi:major facilitator superfamily domain-containing protein [Hypoxylon crocopeplum]|nr:major facilitator superfamily domain-containing protein [Hypoxylon crocopeplum]